MLKVRLQFVEEIMPLSNIDITPHQQSVVRLFVTCAERKIKWGAFQTLQLAT